MSQDVLLSPPFQYVCLLQNVKEAEETPAQKIRRERIEERERKRLQRMSQAEEAGQIQGKGALELEEGVNSQEEVTVFIFHLILILMVRC